MKKFSLSVSDHDNCLCNICHRPRKVLILKYYTKDYASNTRPGKICKTLQVHPHTIWVCKKCLEDLRGEWWGSINERFEKGF